ncbi:hypothetical protein ABT158_21440 [Nonomuraea sp. NPDC001636]|uniref:hypothetical protein n=1 Tax=Nonomuraea sp. NPDC001636 TaxID=3154391 RepID=UPI0033191ABA
MWHTRARNPSNLAHGEWWCLRLFACCCFLAVCFAVCLAVCFAAVFGRVTGWGGWAAGGRAGMDEAACGTAAFRTPAGPRP